MNQRTVAYTPRHPAQQQHVHSVCAMASQSTVSGVDIAGRRGCIEQTAAERPSACSELLRKMRATPAIHHHRQAAANPGRLSEAHKRYEHAGEEARAARLTHLQHIGGRDNPKRPLVIVQHPHVMYAACVKLRQELTKGGRRANKMQWHDGGGLLRHAS